jgi:hypothetical protein
MGREAHPGLVNNTSHSNYSRRSIFLDNSNRSSPNDANIFYDNGVYGVGSTSAFFHNQNIRASFELLLCLVPPAKTGGTLVII